MSLSDHDSVIERAERYLLDGKLAWLGGAFPHRGDWDTTAKVIRDLIRVHRCASGCCTRVEAARENLG